MTNASESNNFFDPKRSNTPRPTEPCYMDGSNSMVIGTAFSMRLMLTIDHSLYWSILQG